MTLARSLALCLSFLLASTAAAQFVGPEVLSSPFTPLGPIDNAPAASIARIGQSAVVAWPIRGGAAGGARILLARLDARLNAIASREVPALSAGTNASSPSIATDGNNILVVWSESAPDVAAALFDRDLNLLVGPTLLLAGDYRGHATSSGDTFVVVVKNIIFRFKSSTLSSPETIIAWAENSDSPALGAMDGLVVNPTFGIQLVGIWTTQVKVGGGCPVFCWHGCPPCTPVQFVDQSKIFFLTLYRDPIIWKPPAPASFRTIASGITDTLTIWRTESAKSIGALVATVIPGDPKSTIPPALRLDVLAAGEPGAASAAWDGERYAVVWQVWTSGDPSQRNHGIAFATIENGSIALQSILIDTPADELRPFIVALAPGRYIVGYEVVNGTEHRLGGRVVVLEPGGRRRPAGWSGLAFVERYPWLAAVTASRSSAR